MLRFLLCLLLFVSLAPPVLRAKEPMSADVTQELIEKKEKVEEQKEEKDADKEKKEEGEKPRNGYLIIPAIYYTPETSIAMGISALFYYRPSNQPVEKRPSVVQPTVIYTTKEQVILSIGGENYFDTDQRWYFYYRLAASKYPDKFWGIGNDTCKWDEEDFTAWYGVVDVVGRYKVWGDLALGFRYRFNAYDMRDLDKEKNQANPEGIHEPALLPQGTAPGSRGGYYNTVGPLIVYDSRDLVSWPSRGMYATLSFFPYHYYTGSSANFYQGEFDFRWYHSLLENHVFSLQWDTVLSEGDVPFTMMPRLGGREKMRGLPEGRFRDRNMTTLQAEIRFPVVWRLGMVFFAGAGNVWNRFADFHPERITYSGGLGVRLRVHKSEKVNMRADLGVTKEGLAVYFYLMEAF